MARVLVEIDDFTASITVPEAGDARSDAAEVVADIPQRLANRTKNLDRRVNERAVLASANVFIAAPQTVNSTDNEVALFETSTGSLDDPAVPGNDWKSIDNFKCESTRNFHTYTGGNNGAGMFAVVVNAHWHKSDSKWRYDKAGEDCFALLVIDEQLRICRQTATHAPWSTWPTDKGDVVIGGDILFAAPVRRYTLLNLDKVSGAALRLDASGRVTFDTSAPAGSVELAFACDVLPVGAVIIGVDVLVNQHDAANPITTKFRARPAVSTDFSSPAAINMFTRDTKVGPAATGMANLPLDPSAGGGGYTVAATEEYQVTVARGGGVTAVTDEVHAIRVVWDDYGGLR